jgi:hypothetical protein
VRFVGQFLGRVAEVFGDLAAAFEETTFGAILVVEDALVLSRLPSYVARSTLTVAEEP